MDFEHQNTALKLRLQVADLIHPKCHRDYENLEIIFTSIGCQMEEGDTFNTVCIMINERVKSEFSSLKGFLSIYLY